eukprot:Hpha_TRINITY_DN13422_c0_g1::TRINITY_DN13422_c0_g1_i3::g.131332::m.131332
MAPGGAGRPESSARDHFTAVAQGLQCKYCTAVYNSATTGTRLAKHLKKCRHAPRGPAPPTPAPAPASAPAPATPSTPFPGAPSDAMPVPTRGIRNLNGAFCYVAVGLQLFLNTPKVHHYLATTTPPPKQRLRGQRDWCALLWTIFDEAMDVSADRALRLVARRCRLASSKPLPGRMKITFPKGNLNPEVLYPVEFYNDGQELPLESAAQMDCADFLRRMLGRMAETVFLATVDADKVNFTNGGSVCLLPWITDPAEGVKHFPYSIFGVGFTEVEEWMWRGQWVTKPNGAGGASVNGSLLDTMLMLAMPPADVLCPTLSDLLKQWAVQMTRVNNMDATETVAKQLERVAKGELSQSEVFTGMQADPTVSQGRCCRTVTHWPDHPEPPLKNGVFWRSLEVFFSGGRLWRSS